VSGPIGPLGLPFLDVFAQPGKDKPDRRKRHDPPLSIANHCEPSRVIRRSCLGGGFEKRFVRHLFGEPNEGIN
jgi:hypothetical protein